MAAENGEGLFELHPTKSRNARVLMGEQMANAGWHYAPSGDSNDFARCAYCELSLDGWEATDSPLEEHQRRSPLCIFFNWKSAKRPTKKARASLQSTANSVTSAHGDDSDAPVKKVSRTKKAKKSELNLAEPAEPSRGRKRPSAAAQGPVIIYDGSKDTDSEIEQQPPPTKKRATRASLVPEQTRDHNIDHTMAENSEADSITSTMSKTTKPPAKRKPGRRPSKVRAPSKTRPGARKPKNILSDDEIDRALAADLERPLTDEEEGFKDFKTPFIRPPARRLTRSRASIAVEESARDAPAGMLLHTSTAAKRGRSRTPAVVPMGETPLKNFNFHESSQDFSLPVRLPKHLVLGEEVVESAKSPERRRQEGVAEGIARGFNTEQIDVDIDEPKVKKAPAKKAAKGRKKGSEAITVTVDEPEAPKVKRGKLTKKTNVNRSRSNTAESYAQPLAPLVVEIIVPSHEVTAQYEQSYDAATPPKPKRGRPKGKIVKGTSRGSAISIASTAAPISDAPGKPAEHEPTPEPPQSFMDVDPAPADLSDAGSVIRYDLAVAATSDAESEEPKQPTPKPKQGKKSSGTSKRKKTTRSSQATTLSMSTDGAASVINSGEESDMSRASHSGLARKTRKVVKKSSKKTLAAQRSREDMLKKGSESFFASSQNEELANDAKRGRGKKVIGSVDMASAKGDPTEPMSVGGSSAHGSFVSDAGDVRLVGTSETKERPPVMAAAGGVVSWADADYPRLVAEEGLSATDVDTESENLASPIDVPPSPARRPLSPMRTAINIPLAATPKSHGKASGRLASSRSWTAVDLESVLANLNTGDEQEEEDDDGQVLGGREMDMTVEEWIRFSAAEAEFRMTGEAERVIGVFEREGRRAIECMEGLVTVD